MAARTVFACVLAAVLAGSCASADRGKTERHEATVSPNTETSPTTETPKPPAPTTHADDAAAGLSIPERSEVGNVPAAVATGSFRAAAPENWPCAIRSLWDTGEQRNVQRFVYGSTKTCRIPVSFTDAGIIGCAERVVLQRDGEFYDVQLLTYSGDDLVRVDSNMGTTTYDWDRDVPTIHNEPPGTRSRGRIEWTVIWRSVVDVDDDGRALFAWNAEDGVMDASGEFDWTGERLEAIQWYAHDQSGNRTPTFRKELIYDCTALPAMKKSVNSGGQLGL